MRTDKLDEILSAYPKIRVSSFQNWNVINSINSLLSICISFVDVIKFKEDYIMCVEC